MAQVPSTTALAVFIVLFVSVALLGFFAARWHQSGEAQISEWGLGGRRFGTLITWFLLGGDLYTAYTFIAVPTALFGLGASGLLRRALHDLRLSDHVRRVSAAMVGGARQRLCDGGGFRARTLRLGRAGARGCGHRHRGHHALHRAPACRHGSGAGGVRHSRPLAARDRLRDRRGLHLHERPACARYHRGGEGPSHLHHGDRRHHHHPGRARAVTARSSRACRRQNFCSRRRRRTIWGKASAMRRWRWVRRWRCSSIRMR